MTLNLPSMLVWAFAATVALTGLMSLSQGMGWTRLSLPFMIGSIVTEHRGRAMIGGIFLHLLLGFISAFPYALGMEDLGRTGWWIGGLMGVLHGAFVLSVVMPVIPYAHPRMASEYHGPTPTRQLEPPGFMARNYGRRTAVITFIGHVLYGSIIGAFYRLA